MLKKITSKMSYVQIIVSGFLLIILAGTALLCLDIASAPGEKTDFLSALFTATSATCVTGLVLFDTATHFSFFGQFVILVMIQIGGLGLMTVISAFALAMRRRIGVYERRLLAESTGTATLGGVVKLLRRIILGTFVFEGLGSLILFSRFIKIMDLGKALWYSVFHSVSAFCNAGFDLFGTYGKYSSLTMFAGDGVVLLCIAALIIIGGAGFVVWSDIIKSVKTRTRLSLHTKAVIIMSASILALSFLLFFIFEENAAFSGMTLSQRLINSFFQAATPRTAGFNAVDMNALSDSGVILTVVLMLIGGSPGSTAGGIKTTTLLVMFAGMFTHKNNGSIVLFKRRIPDEDGRDASTIITVYLMMVIIASLAICYIDALPLKDVIFETASAVGTVGLSRGITSCLSIPSRIIVILLMFCGRIGALSATLAFAGKTKNENTSRPEGKILIG